MLDTRPSRATFGEMLVAIAAGCAAFWYAVGVRVLDVTNVRWLLVGDSAQAYLGWEFFRKTPLLQWPLGDNPNFGTGFSSSIVFADGIPLVSIVLKPLVAWYEGPFQFHGWWLLLAFVLQAVLTVKVLERLGTSRVNRVLALPVVLLQPAFLDRMRFEGYGHLALSAHWLMLLGIWLFLRRETTHRQWTLALLLAIGVTLYYFVVLGMFYVGWVVMRVIGSQSKLTTLGKESGHMGVSGLAAVVFIWIIGGLASTSLGDTGLGVYRATFTSLIDPATLNGVSWTRLSMIGDVTNQFGTQEGFAFLGVSSIVLAIIAFFMFRVWVPRTFTVRSAVLAAVTVVFVALALSPRIAIGPREIATYQVPNIVSNALSVVRASGRLMWIPMYLVVFFAIVVISKRLMTGSRVALSLLIIVVLFHIVDTTSGVDDVRSRFNDTQPTFVTDNSQWDEWARGKQHLIAIPPLSNDPRWLDLALLAERNGLTTNAAYVSRKDEAKFVALSLRLQSTLERREFANDTLYVITNYPPNPESPKLLAEYLAEPDRRLRVYQVEELTVVVP
jgi:hypothetical protein